MVRVDAETSRRFDEPAAPERPFAKEFRHPSARSWSAALDAQIESILETLSREERLGLAYLSNP
jgi:hypothetical protein